MSRPFGKALVRVLLLLGMFQVAVPALAQSIEYYHTDALGTPITITDADRNVLEHREYEPYGQLLSGSVTDGPGYTGHETDAATGMVYMQQRYYDPEIGRFLSVDPVTPDGGGGHFNRYQYANDNPYAFTDPDGRESLTYSARNNGGAGAVEGFDPDRSNAGAHRNDTARAYNKSVASQTKYNPRTALAAQGGIMDHIKEHTRVGYGATFGINKLMGATIDFGSAKLSDETGARWTPTGFERTYKEGRVYTSISLLGLFEISSTSTTRDNGATWHKGGLDIQKGALIEILTGKPVHLDVSFGVGLMYEDSITVGGH